NALAREHQESPWDSVVTIDSHLRALRFGDTKIRCIRLVSIDDKKANVHHKEEAMHGPSQPQSSSPNLPNIAPILLCLLWSFDGSANQCHPSPNVREREEIILFVRH
ncbi:unnamed protein product, partial [Musa acuminata subsp. burmannicoides]